MNKDLKNLKWKKEEDDRTLFYKGVDTHIVISGDASTFYKLYFFNDELATYDTLEEAMGDWQDRIAATHDYEDTIEEILETNYLFETSK